jgi:hypothetical protein
MDMIQMLLPPDIGLMLEFIIIDVELIRSIEMVMNSDQTKIPIIREIIVKPMYLW